MGLKKNSPLIPVRIGVLCFYTVFKNFKFLEFPKTLLNTPHLGSFSAVNSLFFLVPGSDFRPSGVRISNGITLRSVFFQNRTDFLKFCNFIACAKTLLNTPHLGWCSAVNFWRNSTRLSGFLAVIFTSQWLLASRNHWVLRKAKNSLQEFIKSLKNSGDFWKILNFIAVRKPY